MCTHANTDLIYIFFSGSKKNGCCKNDKHSWETSGVIKLNSGVREKEGWLDCRQKDVSKNFPGSAVTSSYYEGL